jgi:hypothetical protein
MTHLNHSRSSPKWSRHSGPDPEQALLASAKSAFIVGPELVADGGMSQL